MHVMEEMPFSHGCHDLVAEPEEAVGRLMDMRGACQAKSVQSIKRLAALISWTNTETTALCLTVKRVELYVGEMSRTSVCVHVCVC